MAKTLKNPQAALQGALQNDPRFQQVMNFINQNGGNPEQVFYQEAQRRNADPNPIIAQTRQILSNRK